MVKCTPEIGLQADGGFQLPKSPSQFSVIRQEPATAGLSDQADCNTERDRVAAVRATAKAGYRLASLLNQTFK
jgi:hypothetical protein